MKFDSFRRKKIQVFKCDESLKAIEILAITVHEILISIEYPILESVNSVITCAVRSIEYKKNIPNHFSGAESDASNLQFVAPDRSI